MTASVAVHRMYSRTIIQMIELACNNIVVLQLGQITNHIPANMAACWIGTVRHDGT
jgi:hypothetical protein